MLIDGHERFLPFAEFPWFKQATVEAIVRLERPTPGHLHWPELDVDVALDSIEHPERYPLTSRPRSRLQARCAPAGSASARAASAERDAALGGRLDFYNRRRPHGALSHKPPIARLHELNNLPGNDT